MTLPMDSCSFKAQIYANSLGKGAIDVACIAAHYNRPTAKCNDEEPTRLTHSVSAIQAPHSQPHLAPADAGLLRFPGVVCAARRV